MAIFNRVLDFFNGDMGPVERPEFQVPMSQPYVDDMFDPLFNRDVVEYNRNLYGTLGAIPAGYAQMWENALTGREGILGPGMGILSTFGRSMDKADDFILGGLTEGVNSLGRFIGTNDAPTNPIRNIFVEDQDYEGSDLVAAMGNAMGKLAGGVKLDRGDFANLPDRLQSSVINLATDPGFMGGSIARANPANRMAKALDDYDNTMAAVAGNVALPGLKTAAQAGLRNVINLFGTIANKPLRDTDIDDYDYEYFGRMADSYADLGGTDHLSDMEYNAYRILSNNSDWNIASTVGSPVKSTTINEPSLDDVLGMYENRASDAERQIYAKLNATNLPLKRSPSELMMGPQERLDLSNPSEDFLDEFKRLAEAEIAANKGGLFDDQLLMQDYLDGNPSMSLQDMYDFYPGVRRIADQAADVAPPSKNAISGKAYLTVSDASLRRLNSEEYAALHSRIFDDAYSNLSNFAKGKKLTSKEALVHSLIEYTHPVRNPSQRSLVSTITGNGTYTPYKQYRNVIHSLRHLFGHMGDATGLRAIAEKYLDIQKANPKAKYREILKRAVHSLGEGTGDTYKYDEVQEACVGFFRSIGADIPFDANLDKAFKWYAEHKEYADFMIRHSVEPNDLEPAIRYALDVRNGDAVLADMANLPKYRGGTPDVFSVIERPTMELPEELDGFLSQSYANIKNDMLIRRMSNMKSIQDAKNLNELIISRWYESEELLRDTTEYLNDMLKKVPKAMQPRIEAQLHDIETLETLVKRLERLEQSSSSTVPKYIRTHYGLDYGGLNDQLMHATTSAGIGDDMKSLMDYMDMYNESSPKSAVPLEWRLRPHQKILANDVDESGKQIRPEARLLLAFSNPHSISMDEWKRILSYKPSDAAFKPTSTMSTLLSQVGFKPMERIQLSDGSFIYKEIPNADYEPLIIPRRWFDDDGNVHDGFKFNDMLTPEMAYLTDYAFSGRLGKAAQDIEIRPDGVYIGNDALNYFTRHSDIHKPIEYAVAEKIGQTSLQNRYTQKMLNTWTPEETAELATNPPFMGAATYYGLSDSLTQPIAQRWNMNHLDPLNPDHVSFIRKVGTPGEKSLFAYLSRMAVKARNSKLNRTGSGFLNEKTVGVIKRAEEAMKKYKPDQVYEYIRRRDASSDAVVLGKNFVHDLANSEGFKVLAYDKNADVNQLFDVLTANVKKVNDAAGEPVLKVITLSDPESNTHFLGYAFDTSNANIKKHLNSYVRHFDGTALGLQDVVFSKGVEMDTSDLDPEMVAELDSIFNDTTSLLNEYTGRLGFTPYSDGYVRHDLTDDATNSFKFVNHKKELGVMDARRVAAALGDIKEFDEHMRKTFGAKAYGRSWYGDLSHYGTGFSHDLGGIVKNTFTKGALDNADVALAQELFFNNNFSLKGNFRDAEAVMNALRQEGSGNMTNLQVVIPKFDNGIITGFRRIDAYDDAGIRAAFEDPNAILAPKSIFGKLDRILKKEAKMHSSAYRFFQKYLTVPFKLGVINNLGFLFGNVQDASAKQVESFMRRYGTSMTDECYNAAMAYRHSVALQNSFSDVVDKYVEFLKGDGIPKNEYSNALASIEKTGTVDPALITGNPHYFDEFVNWISSRPDNDAIGTAKLYLFAHSIMDSGTFENNYLDLEDLAQAGNNTESNVFDKPLNIADRVLYGDRSQGEKSFSFGPFKGKRLTKPGIVTNPGTNFSLKPSNEWEHTTRLATILNYMTHEGWTDEKILKTLESQDPIDIRKLRMDMVQGVDMMNHANFDYDDVTEFMDKISYIVPFPTFYLKNIAHWMEVFAEHPEMIDNVISFQEGMWQDRNVREDEFAAEAKGRGAYPLGGRTMLGTGIVKQSPLNSMFSAFSAVNNMREDFAYRTNPVLRPITRHLQDAEDVKYRPYSMDPYERNIRKGDKQFSELAYMFHQLNPYDRFLNTYPRTPRKIATNDAQMSDFLPSVFQPDFGKKRR